MSDAQKLLPPADTFVADEIYILRSDDCGFGYRVRCGERYAEGLTQDEALFVVATWIVSNQKRLPYLRTKVEQRALEQRLVKIAKELPIVTE